MDVTTLIGSYAFPIVACIAMAWFIWDDKREKRKSMTEYVKIAENIVSGFIDALNSNSEAIQRLECVINKMIREDEENE